MVPCHSGDLAAVNWHRQKISTKLTIVKMFDITWQAFHALENSLFVQYSSKHLVARLSLLCNYSVYDRESALRLEEA